MYESSRSRNVLARSCDAADLLGTGWVYVRSAKEQVLDPNMSKANSRREGGRFQNPIPTPQGGGFMNLFRYLRDRKTSPWPFISAEPGPPPEERVSDLRVTLVNHATVLIQQSGLNVLTDPIWSDRTSPVSFAGPKRSRPPGLRYQDLPPIDVVLLSHDHYDHLDRPTLARLARDHRPKVLCGLRVAPRLTGLGFEHVEELDWWQSTTLGSDANAMFVPAQHFSGRTLLDRDTTLWGGFVLRTPAGVTFFAGDTAKGPHFEQIRREVGAPRLSLLPIGAYLPNWFMSRVHVSPAEALEAHHQLESRHSVAIHYGTFRLSDEEIDQPAHDLEEALRSDAEQRGTRTDFRVLSEGHGWDVPGENAPSATIRQP